MAETMTTSETERPRSIDFWEWFSRVAKYDFLMLLMLAGAVIQIARVFPQAGTYQVVGLSIGPIIGYFARLYGGVGQIHGNVCHPAVKRRQLVALAGGSVVLAAVNSFVAYRAFHLNRGASPMSIVVIATAIYLPLVIFAMYPGRTRSDESAWRD